MWICIEKHYSGKYIRLDIRFKKQFCYIDAFIEPYIPDDFPPPNYPETKEEYLERVRNNPMHLCRLRHFSEDRLSVAYYSYSKMNYVPSVFDNGAFEGTPEEGFEVGAIYLKESWEHEKQ